MRTVLLVITLSIATIAGLTMMKFTTKVTPSTTQEPTRVSQLSDKLEVGVVELYVRDLESQKQFYVDLVGLDILSEDETTTTLGYGSREVLKLSANEELPVFPSNSAGLYHVAILFESRSALAQALSRILDKNSARFSGSSDHIVSEAFYFQDPEENGVELYFDRDPASWVWHEGRVVMGSTYIDPVNYITQYGSISASPVKKMGHIHLQVGDILKAREFYVDVLGFYITAEMPTALFISDGQYHHTIGMNVWHSYGAGPRQLTLGLKRFEIVVSQTSDIDRLKSRLNTQSVQYTSIDGGLTVRDPWNNEISFHTD